MNIIFKCGEHYYEAGESGTFLSVILTFLGAFLGLLGALWIDRRVKRREKNKLDKENKLSKLNQLG